jgi:hypothetical protein
MVNTRLSTYDDIEEIESGPQGSLNVIWVRVLFSFMLLKTC